MMLDYVIFIALFSLDHSHSLIIYLYMHLQKVKRGFFYFLLDGVLDIDRETTKWIL